MFTVRLPNAIQDLEHQKFGLNDENEVFVRTNAELSGSIQPKGLSTAGRVTEITLNALTWTALPATPLAARNAMGIQNTSAQDIKVNFDPGVSGFVGMLIASGSERTYDITDQILIYAKCTADTVVINVEEIS